MATAFFATPASASFYANGNHSLHTGPGGAVSGNVADGQRIGVLKCRDKWCLVTVGRRSGWLESRFIGVTSALTPLPPSPGLPMATLPPTWRHGLLDLPRDPLDPPEGKLADPGLHF